MNLLEMLNEMQTVLDRNSDGVDNSVLHILDSWLEIVRRQAMLEDQK